MTPPTLAPLAARAWQAAIVLGLMGAWSVASVRDPALHDVFGDPAGVARQLGGWFRTGEIFYHVAVTGVEALVGFAAGVAGGIVVGFTLTFVPSLRRLLDPLLGVLAVVPRLVLAPIFMVWFGLGITSKAALVATVVFFIVYFNVEAGLRSVGGILVDRARVMGAGPLGLVREIYLPASVVWLLSSLKLSVGFAFLGAIVAEYLGSNAGLGSLIASAQALNDPNGVMAGLLVVLVVVLPLDHVVTRVERWSAAWMG